ncbi:hypothetical protein AVEN_203585-1 [Araneus ventricosus]|uniref:Uncharacterized protein n=1 Tax=Araneus ventricosus TaxID=182803 RepID=A0A4Y2EPA6_ARAVE|nr:hypothetical protein AVEN_203585-1 [Araneus ventricosus]
MLIRQCTSWLGILSNCGLISSAEMERLVVIEGMELFLMVRERNYFLASETGDYFVVKRLEVLASCKIVVFHVEEYRLDGLRNYEPDDDDEDNTCDESFSPNFPTIPSGGRISVMDLTYIMPACLADNL